jgi:PAS domain S-box-containing protein
MIEPMPEPLAPAHPRSGARAVLRPLLIATPIGLIAVLATGGWRMSPVEITGSVVLLLAVPAALYALSVGRARTASGLFIVALIASAISSVVGYGSLRALGSLTLLGAVAVAGIFHERRVLVGTVLTTIGLVLAFVYAEMQGIMTSLNRPIGAFHAVIFSISLVLLGFLVHYSRTLAVEATNRLARQLREREQAERAAQQAEERLRLSMEATRQGWFDLDIPTGAVLASTHFVDLVGADRERPDMSKKTWIASIHPDDRLPVLAVFEECLRTGETRQMEYRMRAHTGEYLWMRSIAKVVEWDADGRPLRMTGTHMDISDQMQVTQSLRQSERQYRALVELSPVAIVVHREGVVQYVNAAAPTLLGAHTSSEVIGQPLSRLFAEGDLSDVLAPGAGASAAETAGFVREHRLVRVAGPPVDVSVQSAPITFEGAEAMQLICTDISSSKRASESLLRSRQMEALGTLAGGIAHDFNNIISAIRGNAELAAMQVGGEHPVAESLEEISRAGARASEIVRRITAFGRPTEPVRAPVVLPRLLDEVLQLLRPTIPAGIAFHVEAVTPVPPIWVDAAQLYEALVNLTVNAAEAIGMRQVGSITFAFDAVEVSAGDAPVLGVSPGGYVRISVRDTGDGMDAATITHAFDAFFTTKPVGQGSGLGLSMVYGTVTSHGGTVTVESTPGSGATFRLYLPTAPGAKPKTPAEGVAAAGTPVARRVLFVGDEPSLVRLATLMLERAGHRVEGFTDPAQALERFRRGPQDFDLVVTDLAMPGMSGLELARAVNAIRADAPIVMTTGDAHAADATEVAEAGVRFVSVKGSAKHQLLAIVEQAFEVEADDGPG